MGRPWTNKYEGNLRNHPKRPNPSIDLAKQLALTMTWNVFWKQWNVPILLSLYKKACSVITDDDAKVWSVHELWIQRIWSIPANQGKRKGQNREMRTGGGWTLPLSPPCAFWWKFWETGKNSTKFWYLDVPTLLKISKTPCSAKNTCENAPNVAQRRERAS